MVRSHYLFPYPVLTVFANEATKDLIGQAQFCLDVTARAVPVYETVFDVEYPLPKLDTLVAHDFDAGAMENWVRSTTGWYPVV